MVNELYRYQNAWYNDKKKKKAPIQLSKELILCCCINV